MNKSILVAVDLAHPEDAASLLERGVYEAKEGNAHLAVVTVIPDYGMSIVGSFFQEGADEEALKYAAERLHALTATCLGADRKVQHVVRRGNAYEGILIAADEVGADLIVIGAHKPDVRDYLLGPNSARVVRHAQASVLVVRR